MQASFTTLRRLDRLAVAFIGCHLRFARDSCDFNAALRPPVRMADREEKRVTRETCNWSERISKKKRQIFPRSPHEAAAGLRPAFPCRGSTSLDGERSGSVHYLGDEKLVVRDGKWVPHSICFY